MRRPAPSPFRFFTSPIGAALLAGAIWAAPASCAGRPLKVAGAEYVDVDDFAARFGLSASWLERGKKMRLKSQWTTIDLEADSRDIQVNGLRVILGDAVVSHRRSLYISRIDAERLLGPVLAPQTAAPAPDLKVIALDPGHGGNDTGTRNKPLNLEEKDFTLDVATRLKKRLLAEGYQVVMTRTDDTYVGLEQRADIAGKAGADLFISIHFNAFTQPGVNGAETYTMTPQYQKTAFGDPKRADPGNESDAWNAVLGYHMHRQLLERLGAFDRGLKHERYAVLRLAKCPAVLIEAGYLSNEAEARKIATPEYREQIAEAIAAGVKAYAAALDRARGKS